MKKPTDFAVLLSGFLTEYLPAQKGASVQTIASYRDTFKLQHLIVTHSNSFCDISGTRKEFHRKK